jgi:hypothetical protein
MIKIGHRHNFALLQKAFAQNDVALLECKDRATGSPVVAICAVQDDGDEIEFVPLAKLFEGNPYEELMSPFEAETTHDV